MRGKGTKLGEGRGDQLSGLLRMFGIVACGTITWCLAFLILCDNAPFITTVSEIKLLNARISDNKFFH